MSYDLADQWLYLKEPSEWKPTPLIPLDLSQEGYGKVWIKDESDPNSNPTGTVKDRLAAQTALIYRDFAWSLYGKIAKKTIPPRFEKLTAKEFLNQDKLEKMSIPRLSIISTGNAAIALAHFLEKNHLPPPKILISQDVSPERIEKLKNMRTDIYLTNLAQKPLTSQEILLLTENHQTGVDLTSYRSNGRAAFTVYSSLFFELLNAKPVEIYLSYGSGQLFDSLLQQKINFINTLFAYSRDLVEKTTGVSARDIFQQSIIGVEPEDPNSIADHLTAPYKPFGIYINDTLKTVPQMYTGPHTEIMQVSETYVQKAYHIMKKHLNTEPSASAGLAGYCARFDRLDAHTKSELRDKKTIVINTGKGIFA